MSNQTIELLATHRSERAFRGDPVPESVLTDIVAAAHRAPSSVNAQHISLVVTHDLERRKQIAEIAGGQAWITQAPVFITVLLDFNKARIAGELCGKAPIIQNSIEGLLTGAIDGGIALSNLMLAARAQGLGVVPIGGIRNHADRLIKLLELPPLAFPLVGLCIGYVATPAHLKPRLSLATFCHNEVYDDTHLEDGIRQYDEELRTYWQAIERPDGLTWSANTLRAYERSSQRKTVETLHNQGFSISG